MRLKIKISFLLFSVILLFLSLVLFISYQQVVKERESQLRKSMLSNVQLMATLIDGDLHHEIPVNSKAQQRAAYRQLQEQLIHVKKSNPDIRFLYTIAPSTSGELVFVVDATEDKENFVFPGTKFDSSKLSKDFQEHFKAFVDPELYTDDSGDYFSSFAPIFNSEGEVAALLGMDMSADFIQEEKAFYLKLFLYLLILSSLTALAIGGLIGRKISQPIEELSKGTQYIASGHYEHRVTSHRDDEIGELAHSFNQMSQHVQKSFEDLKIAFINAITSLTTALEAKDPYTKGHAMRVGRYSYLIAKEMDVPDRDLQNLEALAAMHDIGKIGVVDSVLRKPAPLNEEEREIMSKHPEIGEEILKPLAYFEPDLLKLIRWHHERPDGKGYPDGLKGDEIPLLVLIVAVADAYDAMITNRPYREGMPADQAIKELYKNADTQYDRKVIEALERVLEKGLDDEFSV